MSAMATPGLAPVCESRHVHLGLTEEDVLRMYRIIPHSSDDDRIYRSRQEVEAWKKRDPIVRFRKYLQAESILTDDLDREIKARVQAAADEATEYAERAPYPKPEEALEQVYATSVEPLNVQRFRV